MILLLNTSEMHVSVRNASFLLTTADAQKIISTKKIEAIIVSDHVAFDKKAVILAAEYDIAIYFLDKMGQTKAVCRSAGYNNASALRRAQVWFQDSNEGLAWVKDLLNTKLMGILSNLNYFEETLPSQKIVCQKAIDVSAQSINSVTNLHFQNLAECRNILLGYEGTAAKSYWSALSDCLPLEHRFNVRSKHPALDGFNAALNYLYGILYTLVETAIYAVGLDPQLGIYHADQYQKPTLVFDMIEHFRQWPERFLFDFYRSHIIEKSFFEAKSGGVFLATKGKTVLIPAFMDYLSKRTTFMGKINSRRGHIQAQAGELAIQLFNFKKP